MVLEPGHWGNVSDAAANKNNTSMGHVSLTGINTSNAITPILPGTSIIIRNNRRMQQHHNANELLAKPHRGVSYAHLFPAGID